MTNKQNVLEVINSHNENGLFYSSEIFNKYLKNNMNEITFSKIISRLNAEKEIERISKGFYSLCVKTKYGNVYSSEDDIVDRYVKENKGIILGYKFYNNIGLTTQISKHILIYSNNTNSEYKKIRNIEIRRFNIDYNNENKKALEMLDILNNFLSIEDINNNVFIDFTSSYIKDYNEEAVERIIETCKYPKSTIAFLKEILDCNSIKNNLGKYLSSFSKYNYPDVGEIYGITREPGDF